MTLAALLPIASLDGDIQTPHSPQAGVLYFVNTTSDTVVAGACANGLPNCSLRGAIQAANSHPGEDGIDVDLPAGSIINLTGVLPDITDSVSITGFGPASLTVRRDTGGDYRIFNVTTAAFVAFSGMTIQNGNAGAGNDGGGISNTSPNSVLNVTNCALLNNAVGHFGGGISSQEGSLSLTNCTFSGNFAGRNGGAINFQSALAMTMTNCTVQDNHVGPGNIFQSDGGGVFIRADPFGLSMAATINNCTIVDNSALGGGQTGFPAYGGGIYVYGCTLNIANSTIARNFVTDAPGNPSAGGGVFVVDAFLNLTNCTISGNAGEWGGAIYANFGGGFDPDGTLTVTNCTISGNIAPISPFNPYGGRAGGILVENQSSDTSHTPRIKSCIIALNTASMSGPDLTGTFMSQGFNLVGKNNDAVASFPAGNPNANNDIVGTNPSPIDPKLDPSGLQNNGGPTQTIALLVGSPAIDKGTSNGLTGSLTTDQRGTGFARTLDYSAIGNAGNGDGTDIGAFEFGGPLAPISVSRKMHGGTPFDIALPLTGAVGIECRTGGASGIHQLIMNFPAPVSLTSASVTSGIGSVSNHSVSGSNITVNLINISNAQTIMVTLFGVSDGSITGDVTIPAGMLLGDTTGNRSVNASDVSQTKPRSGQTADATNFRSDVTANGSINASDVTLVKSKSGTALP